MRLTSLTKIRRNQFWLFQCLGWSALVAILILLSLLFNPPSNGFLLALVFVYAISSFVAAALTLGLRYVYRLVWEKGVVLRLVLALSLIHI